MNIEYGFQHSSSTTYVDPFISWTSEQNFNIQWSRRGSWAWWGQWTKLKNKYKIRNSTK